MLLFAAQKIWFCRLLLFAVLAHFGFEGGEPFAYVLCFGADGHIAVENAGHHHNGHVGKSTATATASGFLWSSAPDSPPCKDIPVVDEDHGGHIPLSDFAKKLLLSLHFLPLVVFFLLTFCFGNSVCRRFPLVPPFIDCRMLALHTTVLRL